MCDISFFGSVSRVFAYESTYPLRSKFTEAEKALSPDPPKKAPAIL